MTCMLNRGRLVYLTIAKLKALIFKDIICTCGPGLSAPYNNVVYWPYTFRLRELWSVEWFGKFWVPRFEPVEWRFAGPYLVQSGAKGKDIYLRWFVGSIEVGPYHQSYDWFWSKWEEYLGLHILGGCRVRTDQDTAEDLYVRRFTGIARRSVSQYLWRAHLLHEEIYDSIWGLL